MVLIQFKFQLAFKFQIYDEQFVEECTSCFFDTH